MPRRQKKTAPKGKTKGKTAPKGKTKGKTAPKEAGSHLTDRGYRTLREELKGPAKDRFYDRYWEDPAFANALHKADEDKDKHQEMKKQSEYVYDLLTEGTRRLAGILSLIMVYVTWSSWKSFQFETISASALICILGINVMRWIVCPHLPVPNIGEDFRFSYIFLLICCAPVILLPLVHSQIEPATMPTQNGTWVPGFGEREQKAFTEILSDGVKRAKDTIPMLHVLGAMCVVCGMVTVGITAKGVTKVKSGIANPGPDCPLVKTSSQYPSKCPHGEDGFVSYNKIVVLMTLFVVLVFFDAPMVTTHAASGQEVILIFGTMPAFTLCTYENTELCAKWDRHKQTSLTGEDGGPVEGPRKFDPNTSGRTNQCVLHETRCTSDKGTWSFFDVPCKGKPKNANWSEDDKKRAKQQEEDSLKWFDGASYLYNQCTVAKHKASCNMSNMWKVAMLTLISVVLEFEFYSNKPTDPEEEWAQWTTNPIVLCCVFIGVAFVAFLPLKGYIIVGIAEVSLGYLAMVGMIIMLCKAPKEWRNTLVLVFSFILLWWWANSTFQQVIKHLQGLPHDVLSKLTKLLKPKKP